MPLLAHLHNAATAADILLWRVTEDESAFADLRLNAAERDELAAVHHPDKRRQWLAARRCLHQLLGPEAQHLRKDAHRRPYLPGDAWHLSISHTNGYAAAIASRTHRVGIDVEELGQQRDWAVRRMFMNTTEQRSYAYWAARDAGMAERYFFAVWCAKEALYKMHAMAGKEASFRRHLHTAVPEPLLSDSNGGFDAEVTLPRHAGTDRLHLWQNGAVLLVYGAARTRDYSLPNSA